MRRLLDAGMRVFADRGFHAARVDDIVRVARTSHGTFYLYFTNKEDLLRALATECGLEMSGLADTLGPVALDAEGYAELRAFSGGSSRPTGVTARSSARGWKDMWRIERFRRSGSGRSPKSPARWGVV